MTLAGIRPGRAEKIPAMDFYPANLPPDEGVQAVLPVLATMAVRKKEIQEALKIEKSALISFSLIYLPFQASGNDYVQEETGMGLPKNALQAGHKP